MDKLLRIFTAFDWVLGSGSLLLGLYLSNYWLVAGGVLGLLAAYYKPAQRIKTRLEKKLLAGRKRTTDDSGQVLAQDAFYAQVLGTGSSEDDAPSPAEAVSFVPRNYGGTVTSYGDVFLSGSKHNMARANHIGVGASAPSKSTFY